MSFPFHPHAAHSLTEKEVRLSEEVEHQIQHIHAQREREKEEAKHVHPPSIINQRLANIDVADNDRFVTVLPMAPITRRSITAAPLLQAPPLLIRAHSQPLEYPYSENDSDNGADPDDDTDSQHQYNTETETENDLDTENVSINESEDDSYFDEAGDNIANNALFSPIRPQTSPVMGSSYAHNSEFFAPLASLSQSFPQHARGSSSIVPLQSQPLEDSFDGTTTNNAVQVRDLQPSPSLSLESSELSPGESEEESYTEELKHELKTPPGLLSSARALIKTNNNLGNHVDGASMYDGMSATLPSANAVVTHTPSIQLHPFRPSWPLALTPTAPAPDNRETQPFLSFRHNKPAAQRENPVSLPQPQPQPLPLLPPPSAFPSTKITVNVHEPAPPRIDAPLLTEAFQRVLQNLDEPSPSNLPQLHRATGDIDPVEEDIRVIARLLARLLEARTGARPSSSNAPTTPPSLPIMAASLRVPDMRTSAPSSPFASFVQSPPFVPLQPQPIIMQEVNVDRQLPHYYQQQSSTRHLNDRPATASPKHINDYWYLDAQRHRQHSNERSPPSSHSRSSANSASPVFDARSKSLDLSDGGMQRLLKASRRTERQSQSMKQPQHRYHHHERHASDRTPVTVNANDDHRQHRHTRAISNHSPSILQSMRGDWNGDDRQHRHEARQPQPVFSHSHQLPTQHQHQHRRAPTADPTLLSPHSGTGPSLKRRPSLSTPAQYRSIPTRVWPRV